MKVKFEIMIDEDKDHFRETLKLTSQNDTAINKDETGNVNNLIFLNTRFVG